MSDDHYYPGVEVELTGHDGNAVAIISRVRRAIALKYGTDAAAKWAADAVKSESYDALLQSAFAR